VGHASASRRRAAAVLEQDQRLAATRPEALLARQLAGTRIQTRGNFITTCCFAASAHQDRLACQAWRQMLEIGAARVTGESWESRHGHGSREESAGADRPCYDRPRLRPPRPFRSGISADWRRRQLATDEVRSPSPSQLNDLASPHVPGEYRQKCSGDSVRGSYSSHSINELNEMIGATCTAICLRRALRRQRTFRVPNRCPNYILRQPS